MLGEDGRWVLCGLRDAGSVQYHDGSPTDGPVAQLGARLNGIQEVTSSILVRSTILRS